VRAPCPRRYTGCTLGAPCEVLKDGGHLRDVPGFESASDRRFSKGISILENALVLIIVIRMDVGVSWARGGRGGGGEHAAR
jgi:hypothetical protein